MGRMSAATAGIRWKIYLEDSQMDHIFHGVGIVNGVLAYQRGSRD